MKRLSCTVGLVALLAAVVAGGGCGGGSSSADIASFYPADNEVVGWSRAPAGAAVQVAHDNAGAQALVDGDADPFSAAPSPFVAFAKATYVNGDYTNDFRIWEVADAAACASLYAYLVGQVPTYSSKTWVDEVIGDAGHSAETASFWWLNACRDKYFLESRVSLTAGGAPDSAAHDMGVTFMAAVSAKIQ